MWLHIGVFDAPVAVFEYIDALVAVVIGRPLQEW
jgi:hypothetical protein